MQNKKPTIYGLALVSLLNTTTGLAAGLEKSVTWSGKYAGVGQAVSSSVEGPESLYFNPAGLANGLGLQTSLNLSPSFIQFTAPIQNTTTTTTSITSNRSFVPPGGALLSYAVTPQLGVGVGYFVSGGTRAIYDSVGFAYGAAPLVSYPTFTNDLKSELTLSELSLGAGYEVIEGLRIGAAYRVLFVQGTLASVLQMPGGGQTPTFVGATIDGLSATRWNGFRLGAQYSPKDSNWGLGAQWRSEIGFKADGTLTGQIAVPNIGSSTAIPVIPVAATPASVGATFPWQVSLGGFYYICPKVWRLLVEYSFTDYQSDKSLHLSGTVAGTDLPSVTLNGNNMNVFRFGTEYKLIPPLTLRAGYVYTSQITPNGAASPIYPTPGPGHTFVVGAGMMFMDTLEGNIAFEYSRSAGTVASGDGPFASGTAVGDYSSNALVGHFGVTYRIL